MLWFALVPFVFYKLVGVFFFGSMALYHHNWDFMDYFMNSMMVCLMTALITFFISGIPFCLGLLFSTEKVVDWRVQLLAIRDENGVAGRFFLGSGMLQGSSYYFYYMRNGDGSTSPGRVEANGAVRIYEDAADSAPTLTRYRWDLRETWAWLVAFPQQDTSYAFEFHVPPNTVRSGFTM